MNRFVHLLVMTLVVYGCGGKETIASKSAAAFREAQKQGRPLGPAEHGHGAITPSDSSEAVDHAAMGHTDTAPTDHASMGQGTAPQMDHASMGHAAPTAGTMRGMDHSRMGHATPATQTSGSPHAGHAMPPQTEQPQTGQTQTGVHAVHSMPPQTAQAQTDVHAGHAAPPQTAQAQTGAHGGHAMPSQQGVPTTPTGSPVAQAEPGQPSATLAPDSLDAPAATSLMDSARSAEISREMASGGHAMHGAPNYRQVDAGRAGGPVPQDGAVAPGSPSGQQQHQHVPPPKENP